MAILSSYSHGEGFVNARHPLPVKSEQVQRLREDKAYPYEEARRELGYAPRRFSEGIALEVARLRKLGLIGA